MAKKKSGRLIGIALLAIVFVVSAYLLVKATKNQSILVAVMAACVFGIVQLAKGMKSQKAKKGVSASSSKMEALSAARVKVEAEKMQQAQYTVSIEMKGGRKSNDESRSTEDKVLLKKGKLLYKLPSQYTVVDLETTGLDCNKDHVIEVAALRVRNGEVVDSFESLIHCPCEIDQTITKLTGITNEMLADAPLLESVLPAFLDFIGNDLLMGHYLNFDIRFLNMTTAAIGKEQKAYKYVDTMYLSRKIFPEWEHHRLDDLVNNLKVDVGTAHRALGDTYRTKGCFDALCEEIRARGLTEADL